MTVGELIDELMKHDLDKEVVVDAFDGNGYNLLQKQNVTSVELVQHRRPDSYGAGAFDDKIDENENGFKAVCIR